MGTNTSAPTKIKKEEIKNLKFGTADVLTEKADVFQRKIDLERASALGAQSKANVKLYFTDENGARYKVEATVWATTEKNVTLKGEVLIPIQSVYKIGFF